MMAFLRLTCLLTAVTFFLWNEGSAQSNSDIELYQVLETDLEMPLGQMRAVPVSLGDNGSAILLVHSESAENDPWEEMFFYPDGTLQFTLIDLTGDILWTRDLGPGVVPGIWFCPVFPFDLDLDGIDEIWFVNNIDADHPLSLRGRRLERLDARSGETTGQWSWPHVPAQTISHTYRNFILGGYAHDEPVLVTAQGTYGPMALQGWHPDMTLRWEYTISREMPGARGSHMTPIVDLDGDGVDEMLWGERAVTVDSGDELFCAGCDTWTEHSDIIQPTLDWTNGHWTIYTTRESDSSVPPRVVMYDQHGEAVWDDIEYGHMDMGWTARLGAHGESVAMAIRIGEKRAGPDGFERTVTDEFVWDAFSGVSVKLPFKVYSTIPVDLNGDGIHELVYGSDLGAGDGSVIDREGRVVGNVAGQVVLASKFMNLHGEQVLSYTPDGRVIIWADRNARDNDRARARYAHPYYRKCQRLTATGYNRVNLGGL